MQQILINDTGNYRLTVTLSSNTYLDGTYIDAENAALKKLDNLVDTLNVAAAATTSETKSKIRTYASTSNSFYVAELDVNKTPETKSDITNYFNTNDYFVTGVTDSKYDSIIKSFTDPDNAKIPIYTDKKILLHGSDVYAMVLRNDTIKEYVLYVGTEYPIKYIDFPDGTTNFMYKRAPDYKVMEGKIVYYNGLIDEPKILSEVFIDRGVNNAFEPVKRLKNVDNLKELLKVGLGYYKTNSTGFNFKNAK